MRNWLFKLEVFATVLGILAGLAMGFFDFYILANANVPLGQLNTDIIYPVFFQVGMYAFLLNTNRFASKNIFIGTTFFLVSSLIAFGAVIAFVPLDVMLVRFSQAFPGVNFAWGMVNISIARLTTSFVLMLLALGIARLRKLSKR